MATEAKHCANVLTLAALGREACENLARVATDPSEMCAHNVAADIVALAESRGIVLPQPVFAAAMLSARAALRQWHA